MPVPHLNRKDGRPLDEMSPRIRTNPLNGSLVIGQAQPKLDEGAFECQLVEWAGAEGEQRAGPRELEWPVKKAHRFELRLIVAPKLAPFEFPQSAQVGMKVLLTCAALEGQQPISFVWLKDEQIIEQQPAGPSAPPPPPPASSPAPDSSSKPEVAFAQHGGGPHQVGLGELHRRQLNDKLALSAARPLKAQRNEYLLLGAAEPAPDEEPAEGSAAQAKQPERNRAGEQAGKSNHLSSVLSDASIKIRQSDDYSILSIEPLELKHSARYTCSAQNEAGRTSHSSRLIINGELGPARPPHSVVPQGQRQLTRTGTANRPQPHPP